MSPTTVFLEHEDQTASTFSYTPQMPLITGRESRLAARQGGFASVTSGLAPSYLQANLIVLPSNYASDFRLLCQRNPVPCPLLAESKTVGSRDELKSWIEGVPSESIARDVDLRHDFPRYMVYQDGILTKSLCVDVAAEWTRDHVGFLIGCSYSFDSALAAAALVPPHMSLGRNVAMYRTSIPLCPAGVFTNATYVVSMRPYKKKDLGQVREITRPYTAVHGEPIDWGWEAIRRLGIKDINTPEWGDAPLTLEGKKLEKGVGEGTEELVPIFWGCGVTPQEAVVKANLRGTVMGHAPGHMIVLDIRDWDVVSK